MSSEKLTPFSYINSITNKNIIPMDDSVYSQFLVNRAFSLHPSTFGVSIEANKMKKVSNQVHYDFMLNLISKRWLPRVKWHKPKNHHKAFIISKYYDIPMLKAFDYIGFYSDKEITQMENEIKEMNL